MSCFLMLDGKTVKELSSPPLQQKPGKKTGKPGEVWFNQAYQAFGLNSSLVKSLVCLVLPDFPG